MRNIWLNRFVRTTVVLGVAFVLISWGSTGHYKISEFCSLSFNSEMSEFNDWVPFIRDHASDADDRKSTSDPNYDPNEAKRHYIDIDNYSDFNTTGTLTQNYDAAVSKYGLSFMNNNGILPWATETTFNNLKNSLAAHQWDLAKQYAADLGHYVGDGHMPLHITSNFDGGDTGQSGIHSRYESTMISGYNAQITYEGDTNLVAISNVNQYIFNYIYENHKYVDSVLNADIYAVNLAGGVRNYTTYSSSTYKQALWNKTKGFTIKLFKNASHSLAELIYTAWVQAGKPSLSSAAGINDNSSFTELLEQNYPNPFSNYTKIKYHLPESTNVTVRVADVIGKTVAVLYNGQQTVGSYEVEWTPQNQSEGIYFVILDTQKEHKVRKMLLVK